MRHFSAAVRSALEDGNPYAALALALALPDIAGWAETPQEKSKARYVRWWDANVRHQYTSPERVVAGDEVIPEHCCLTGADCFALRCALLHQGSDETTDQRAREVVDKYLFIVPPPGWTLHRNTKRKTDADGQQHTTLQLQVDIFCTDICDAFEVWLEDAKGATRTNIDRAMTIEMLDPSKGWSF